MIRRRGLPVRGRRRRRNRLDGGAKPRLNQTADGPPGRAARVHGVRLCERRARPGLGRTHPARSRRPARPADDRGLLPSVRGERVRPRARGRRLVRLRVAATAVSSGEEFDSRSPRARQRACERPRAGPPPPTPNATAHSRHLGPRDRLGHRHRHRSRTTLTHARPRVLHARVRAASSAVQ